MQLSCVCNILQIWLYSDSQNQKKNFLLKNYVREWMKTKRPRSPTFIHSLNYFFAMP